VLGKQLIRKEIGIATVTMNFHNHKDTCNTNSIPFICHHSFSLAKTFLSVCYFPNNAAVFFDSNATLRPQTNFQRNLVYSFRIPASSVIWKTITISCQKSISIWWLGSPKIFFLELSPFPKNILLENDYIKKNACYTLYAFSSPSGSSDCLNCE
jgi:hypothetical protein